MFLICIASPITIPLAICSSWLEMAWLTNDQCVIPILLVSLVMLVDISSLLFFFNITLTDVLEHNLTSDLGASKVRVLRACEIITSRAKKNFPIAENKQ